MTSLRTPTARLYFQTKQEHQQGEQNAIVFQSPPWYFECRVNYALSDEAAGIGTCDIELYNVSDEIMSKLEPSGIVRVEAGYEDFEEVKPTTIFYGVVNYAFPMRKGSERVWSIHATTMSPRWQMFVPYSGQNVLIGDVIRYLVGSIGAEVRLPDIAFDPRYAVLRDGYTTERSVEEEFIYLVDQLSYFTGIGFLIAPGVEKPHIRHVVSASSEEDALLFTVDEGANTVYSSGLSPMQGEPDALIVPQAFGSDAAQLAIEVDGEISVFEYNMSMIFDPRLIPGIWVHAINNGGEINSMRSLGMGTLFFTKSIQHLIGGDEWTTEVRGPVLDSDLIAVRREG